MPASSSHAPPDTASQAACAPLCAAADHPLDCPFVPQVNVPGFTCALVNQVKEAGLVDSLSTSLVREVNDKVGGVTSVWVCGWVCGFAKR